MKFLQQHIRKTHETKALKKIQLLKKMESLQTTISIQRNKLTSSLIKLKNKEFKEIQLCRCKGFCVITHSKHNYYKSKAGEICEKLTNLNTKQELHVTSNHDQLETVKTRFECAMCDKKFQRRRELKMHKKKIHMIPKISKSIDQIPRSYNDELKCERTMDKINSEDEVNDESEVESNTTEFLTQNSSLTCSEEGESSLESENSVEEEIEF